MTDEYTVENPPTKCGIYFNLRDETYRAIRAVSQSTLREFMVNPQKWKLSPPKEVTPAMVFGSLVDSIWLSGDTSPFAVEPSVYLSRGMQCPQCKSVTDSKKCSKCKCDREEVDVQKPWSNNSTTCREWAEDQEATGKRIVSADMWATAHDAVARLNGVPEIAKQRERCDVQVAFVAEFENTKVKGLIDLVPKDGFRTALGDLKTAQSANPKDWPKHVFNHSLALQAALYLDGWNQQAGENLQYFWHFVVERDAPHEPCMMPLSDSFIELGRAQYMSALRLWKSCEEQQTWPGYPMDTICSPEPWMIKQAFGE